MRVALIAPGFTPDVGGVETVVSRLAAELAVAGVEVETWVPSRTARETRVEEIDGVVVRRFPATGGAHYPVSPALWRHVRREAPAFDLVHAHSYHSAAPLALLTVADRVRYVYTGHYHGVGHTAPARALHVAYRPLGRRLVSRAAAVVAVSAAERELLARDFPLLHNVSVVPNAVDGELIAAAKPYAGEPPTVLVVGRIERYKRIDLVVDAFDRVGDEARLVVVGSGPDESWLREHVARARRRDDVALLGRVDDAALRRWLRTARVVANLSEREAFGLVGLEGAAAGAHAVLSDLPAHREVAAMAPRHVAVVPADADAVATALQSALTASRLAPAAVRTWSEVADEHLTIYHRVLGRPSVVVLPRRT